MSLVITTEFMGMLEIKIRLFPITAGFIFTAVTAFWLSAPVAAVPLYLHCPHRELLPIPPASA